MSIFSCGMLVTVLIVFRKNAVYCASGFSYFGEKVNYTTALNRCNSLGMTTLVIDGASTSRAVRNYLRQSSKPISDLLPFWIGLEMPLTSSDRRDYRWSSNLPLTWSRWINSEPNKLNIHKCVIWFYGGWRSRDCADLNNFFCQKLEATPLDAPSSSSDGFSGIHFIHVEDKIPAGSELLQIQEVSLTHCASSCLRVEGCDVIVWRNPTNCQLFSDLAVLETGHLATARIYKRIRFH